MVKVALESLAVSTALTKEIILLRQCEELKYILIALLSFDQEHHLVCLCRRSKSLHDSVLPIDVLLIYIFFISLFLVNLNMIFH